MSGTSSKTVPLISTGRTEVPQNYIYIYSKSYYSQLHRLVCTPAALRTEISSISVPAAVTGGTHTTTGLNAVLNVSRKPLGSE